MNTSKKTKPNKPKKSETQELARAQVVGQIDKTSSKQWDHARLKSDASSGCSIARRGNVKRDNMKRTCTRAKISPAAHGVLQVAMIV